ncbi:ROK family protein [Mucilaginibacter sp. ZT4R22]|uniref:ROK family protein n=1 Tax=Mucilaginibacter pankratovii TaxID=2772110 RepID=A0ABR7WVW4_9SPHI|nr:ROK family protein [Mucilaginibacter pankratovii]MBD1365417.1 ROK family protein [Mucilaginibacter pankratovii]
MEAGKKEIAFGIDIGGTNSKFGLVTRDGKILSESSVKTRHYATPEDLIADLYTKYIQVIPEYLDEYQIIGIGIGAPNGNYHTGCIEHAPNLPWADIVPIREIASRMFGLPTALTNDANAAASGELIFGAAKNMKHVIVVTLGTGVGSGIIIDGKMLYGSTGVAGELGHTVIRNHGRQHWTTGSKGVLEAYCSATGIVLTALELAKSSKRSSSLQQIPEADINAKKIYECAIAGDTLCQQAYQMTGQLLGEALANFAMFSSPEAIILFGGVTQAGELLMNPTRHSLEKNLLPVFRNTIKLMYSALPQSDAAILGASSLAWHALLGN